MKPRTAIQRRPKWKRKDLILFLERLELYVAAGLTVDRALQVSLDGARTKQRIELERSIRAVESGVSLSKALTQTIGLSSTCAGLLEHGEASGGLGRAIGMAKSVLEREDELIKKCVSALTYPLVIGIFASLLTIGLVRGVMPQIIPMLTSLHVHLPLLTRVVIAASESFLRYGWYALGVGIFVGGVCTFLYRRVVRVTAVAHICVKNVPFVGWLIRSYFLSLFLSSCGSLVQSGMSVQEAYANTTRTISFIPLRTALQSKISDVGRGLPVSLAIAHRGVPSYIGPLVATGEASGTLGLSMYRAASILDREIEHALKRLTSLIEPVMMAGMGTVVGAIALSIMMPIYDISKVLQH